MTITIDPKPEALLRERAEAEGLTVPAYLERLVRADQSAKEELESLALEGLHSGDPIQVGPSGSEIRYVVRPRADRDLEDQAYRQPTTHSRFWWAQRSNRLTGHGDR